MTRYVDTERFKRERDEWIAKQLETAPPLTERQKVLIRANLTPPSQRKKAVA